jgi:ABC-type nitrate/sulfonate/bicarbonate transport system substrate-binding protein
MKRTVAALLLMLFALIPGSANAQNGPLKTVNAALAFVASSTLPMWIAEDEGLFKKHGLDVKLNLFQGSAAATQALLSGSIDIVFGSASAAITVVGRGVPVAVVATTHLLNYELVTRPDMTSADQLRGKTIGISAFSGGDDFALRRLLPKLGLTLNKDVKFVVLGTPNPYQKAEAVLNGTTDATMVTFEVVDTMKLQHKTLNVIASILPNGIKLSVGDIYATRSFIKKSPDVVENFLRAYTEAIRMAKNDKQLDFKLYRKYTNYKNEGVLEKIYKETILGQFANVPYPNVEAILTQRDDMATTSPDLAKLKTMKVDAFIDNGPLDAIEKAGFSKSLPPLKPQE